MNTEKRNFDTAAAAWDEKPRRIQLTKDIAEAIRQEIKLNSSMDVVDFGCGTGLVTLRLQPFVHSITGVDSSSGMLDVLKSKIKNQNLSNAKTRLIDIDRGDKLEGKYHLVTSAMTMHHIKDVGSLLKQFYETLLPAGHICIADLDLDGGRFHDDNTGVFHNGFDRAVMRKMFEGAGFEDVRSRTAATVRKKSSGGAISEFTVFLVCGRKGR